MEATEIHVKSSRLKALEFENLRFSSAYDFRLTEQDLEKAYRELNEREDSRKDCIRKLRERLERDEEMVYRTDDGYLLRYLRFTKFNCDKAYNSMRKLTSLRIKKPEHFILPTNLEILLTTNCLTCLPYKDGEERLIFWFDYRKWNTDIMSFDEIFVACPAIIDAFVVNPHIQINGFVLIWDFQGLTMKQFSQLMRPSTQRFMFNLLQDSYPYRIKQIFAINCNAIMKAGYAATRFLLKKKVADRVDMESGEIQVKSSMLKALEFENLKFSSAFDFRLTKRDLEKAYRELNEREHLKADCIRKLKERLERDKEILYRTDDNYLLRYLRFNKFNCDKAYNSMQKLQFLRIKHPEFFALQPNLETLLNSNFCTFLPYKDGEGRLIFRIDYRKWNTNVMTFSDILTMIPAIYDVAFVNPHSHIHGVVVICDFQGVTMRHIAQIMRPSLQRFMANLTQECYPWRINQVFAINCNAMVKASYAAVRFLIKDKIANRIKMLGSDLTELHQHVNPAVLPKNYGGTLDESESGMTDLIMDNLDYLKYERSFGLKTNSKRH